MKRRNRLIRYLTSIVCALFCAWYTGLHSMASEAIDIVIHAPVALQTVCMATCAFLGHLTTHHSDSLNHFNTIPQRINVPDAKPKAPPSQNINTLIAQEETKLYKLRQDHPALLLTNHSLPEGCKITGSPTHLRIEHQSGIYGEIKFIEHSRVRNAIDHERNQFIQESADTLARAKIDPVYQANLIKQLNCAIRWLLDTNSLRLDLRIAARAQLAHLQLEQPFGLYLEQAVRDLEKIFYFPDGKLIYPETRTNEAIAPIKKFLQQIVEPNHALFDDPCLVPARECKESFLNWFGNALYRKYAIPYNHHEKIITHPLNRAIIDCYKACLDHDFVRAQELKNKFHGSQSIYQLHRTLLTRYQQKTFDQYGLYLVGVHDPLIQNLPLHTKQQLTESDKITYNKVILLRKNIKEKFQKAWSIPDDAPQAVHHALYTCIPTELLSIPEPLHLLETATSLTQDYTTQDHDALLTSLYQRNGIFKQFAHYRHATIALPEAINSEPYAQTRESLNKLLYYRHTTCEKTTTTAADQAVAYLYAHFKTTDPILSACYLSLYHALSETVTGVGDPLALHLPNLIAPTTYSAFQLDVHRAILATVCTGLDLHRPEYGWFVSNFSTIQKEAEAWIDCAITAHTYNQHGDTEQALTLLEEHFVKPYHLQQDIPSDKVPPPQSAHKPDKNKHNNNKPKPGKGEAAAVTAVALKEQIEEAEAYFAQRLSECADKVARLQKETGFDVQKFDFKHLLDMFTSSRKLIGYHTQIIHNHIQRFIIHPQPDRCYKVIAGMNNSANRFIEGYKSMFPTNWDMCKIIDTFFEAVEKYEKTELSRGGTRIALESRVMEQLYQIVIDLPGHVVTFYPLK